VQVNAQKDSISIDAQLSSDRKTFKISQQIVYHNHSDKDLNSIKLLNWTAAYNKRGTSLVYRKLEDRNYSLHFAKKQELGKVLNLEINSTDNNPVLMNKTSEENLFLALNQPLHPGEKIKLNLHYIIQLPDKKFTGYGTSAQDIALKYFFIVPDHFDAENNTRRNYHDIEESVNFNTYWKVKFRNNGNFFIESNLSENEPNSFQGYLDSDPEFLLTKNEFPSIN
jgi:hypothetical protein